MRHAILATVAIALLVITAGTAAAQPAGTEDAGPPDNLPEPVPDFVGDILGAVSDFMNGVITGLGDVVSGLTPGGS